MWLSYLGIIWYRWLWVVQTLSWMNGLSWKNVLGLVTKILVMFFSSLFFSFFPRLYFVLQRWMGSELCLSCYWQLLPLFMLQVTFEISLSCTISNRGAFPLLISSMVQWNFVQNFLKKLGQSDYIDRSRQSEFNITNLRAS